jgi:hypothetical protein
MRKEDLKDGVFYRALAYKDQIVQHNLLNPYNCRGYANSKWLDAGLICENANLWREATLEELNALGDEHLPYSKYLQVSKPTHKFKVGDTVKISKDSKRYVTNARPKIGHIHRIDNKYNRGIFVKFDNGIENTYEAEDLELVASANPVYTLKDLAEGKVAVVNDGTPEELWKVLCVAFPKDEDVDNVQDFKEIYFNTYYTAAHFKADDSFFGFWADTKDTHTDLPTQSVKVFIKEIEGSYDGLKPDNIFVDEVLKYHKPKYVRRFKSGAVRSDDRGRLRPDYISPYALEEIADHFTQAAKEFGADDFATNYFKGIEPIDVKGSISRHYIDLQKAFAEKDDNKVREELRAMACNCIMALHQIRIAELGLYVEEFDKTEYITKD